MTSPSGDIETPLGKIPRKYAVVGGVVLVAVVALWYRNKKAAAASVATAGGSEVDPATGYAYGSAEDAAALSAQANYQTASTPYTSGSGGANYTGVGTFTNNAEWAQAAEQYLTAEGAVDSASLSVALGKYITGSPVDTTTQQPLIESAIAVEGYPPVSGANGFPPNLNTGPPVTAPTGPLPVPQNLHVIGTSPTSLTVTWDAVTGAAWYIVNESSFSAIGGGWQATSTSYTVTGLKPDTPYTIYVIPVDASNTQGGTARIDTRTSK